VKRDHKQVATDEMRPVLSRSRGEESARAAL
jgi:hypothetical protein